MKQVPATQEEIRLARGCAKGRPAEQEALFNKYYRKMFGVCLRYTKDRDQAEDVLQEGFIKVFSKISGFREEGSLEGWIRKIMVNSAIEHFRKNSRFYTVEDSEIPEDVDRGSDAIANLSADEILLMVQSLPTGFRTVFNLFAIEGFTHEEIGQALGISIGTSKSQLSRAREILGNQIQKSGRISYGNA